jgi:hypothetical protein
VGGIGCEATSALEGMFQAVEHTVEREREVVQFIAGAGDRKTHSKPPVVDILHSCRNALNGAKGAAAHP